MRLLEWTDSSWSGRLAERHSPAFIGVSQPYWPSPADTRSPTVRGSSMWTGVRSIAGYLSTSRREIPASWPMARGGDGRAAATLVLVNWRRSSAAIRVPSATGLRRGPWTSWRATARSTCVAPSAHARSGDACTNTAIAGSVLGMPIGSGRVIWRRKRGSPPSAESGTPARRCGARERLDAAAPLSAAARRVGPGGHVRCGADHGRERETRPLWRDQRPHRASRGARAQASGRGRRAGVLYRTAPALSTRWDDLALARSRECTHGEGIAGLGVGAAHPTRVVAPASTGTQRDGSTVARTQTRGRGQSSSEKHRGLGEERHALGPDADPNPSSKQGRDAVVPLLAP